MKLYRNNIVLKYTFRDIQERYRRTLVLTIEIQQDCRCVHYLWIAAINMSSYTKTEARDVISRGPVSDDEISGIADRLFKTPTKSSLGGLECKVMTPLKSPGYGLPMYPVIVGIESRFVGNPMPESKEKQAKERLHTTHTESSQAKKASESHKALLYPERTILMNDVEKILEYQQTGHLAKQAMLRRREKWYN